MKTRDILWLAPVGLALCAIGCHGPGDLAETGASAATASGGASNRILFDGVDSLLGAPQVYSMNPDGSNLKAITRGSTSSWLENSNDAPSLSPDGTLVAFESGRDFPQEDPAFVQNPTLRMLYTMNPDGSNPKRLTRNDPEECSEHDAHFSHDGQWITFSMACGNVPLAIQDIMQIYRVNVDGTGQQPLIGPSASVYATNQLYPVFSSDGSRVLFVADSQIYQVEVTTGTVLPVTNLPAPADINGRLAVSSSDTVYFVRRTDGPNVSMESIGIDGTGEKTLFTIPVQRGGSFDGAAARYDFALSPDGVQFVFGTNVSELDSGAGFATAISTSTLAGGAVTALTTTLLYGVGHPTWH
jgi:Tol biopolymer transport system component